LESQRRKGARFQEKEEHKHALNHWRALHACVSTRLKNRVTRRTRLYRSRTHCLASYSVLFAV
jgi:hypothetical protein